MAKVTFKDATILEMTNIHPIYTNKGYRSLTSIKYEKFNIGDMAKTKDSWQEITNIEMYTLDKPIITYNLNVIDLDEVIDDETNDNYFANGVVIHNKGHDV